MAFDESLAQRVRLAVEAHCPGAGITEKRMFGGLCVLVNGNMACGVMQDRIMVRVAKDDHEACLELPHAAEMDFTGRPMRGFLYVYAEGIATARDLHQWIARCTGYAMSLPVKSESRESATRTAKRAKAGSGGTAPKKKTARAKR